MTPLAVYVHIPFCTVKCGYCDFNAYAGMDALKDAYAAALLREAEGWRAVLEGRRVTSISFGGGTPGEFPAEAIGGIVAAVGGLGALEAGAEVSLEANPGTLTAGYLAGLRSAGVTRLSLGAQSFDPAELRFLDRIHSPEATAAAVRLARDAGFGSVGLDLIYGLPGRDAASWRRSLDAALALAPDHLSCYALTIEEGTPLARRADSGEVSPLDPDAVADLYDTTCEVLATAGYRHYEISNWARPGHESRHNTAYWTDQEYLALGAGGHGYLDGERYENAAHPRAYIDAIEASGLAVAQRYRPGREAAMVDYLEARLRLVEGFPPAEFAARFGETVDGAFPRTIGDALIAGILSLDADCLRLEPRGWLLHGELCALLLAEARERAGPGARTMPPQPSGAPL